MDETESDLGPMDELSIAWKDRDNVMHWLTPREALRILQRFYEEWPAGLEEFERDRRLFGDNHHG